MIAVRILRDGQPVREQILTALPVRVGRSADNDVVLFDPSVSRHHARIDRDAAGSLVVHDLESRNGVHVGPVSVDHVRGGTLVRCLVGRVALEVEALSDEPTQEIRVGEVLAFDQRRTASFHLRYLALGMGALLLALVIASDFWSPWQKNRSGLLLTYAMGAAAGLPVVALLLLGMLRVVGRRVRIADTLKGLALVLAASTLVQILNLAAYYVLSVGAHQMFVGATGAASSLAAIVYLAGLRRPGHPWRFRLAWGAVAFLLLAGASVASRLEARRTGTPAVDHSVLPPLGGLVGPARPLARHWTRLESEAEAAGRKAAERKSRRDR